MKDELQLKTRDVEFLLYEVFNVDELVKNERYSHHDRETFAAVLELARDFAEQKFYPLAKPLDHNEPYLKDNKVVTIPELKNILDEYRELGFQKNVSGNSSWRNAASICCCSSGRSFPRRC